MPPTPTPAIVRLLRKLEYGECWLYTGATKENGYGVIGESIPVRRGVYVHRVMYEHIHGPIPDGLEIRHTCDVRHCVRPDHLIIGTHQENVADTVSRQRTSRGVKRWSARLVEDDVREIRRRAAAGEKASALAREFQISSSQAEFIIRRLRWKHVA